MADAAADLCRHWPGKTKEIPTPSKAVMMVVTGQVAMTPATRLTG